MQINTTTRYHLIFVKMAMIKKIDNNNCVEKRKHLYHVGKNVIRCSYYEKYFKS